VSQESKRAAAETQKFLINFHKNSDSYLNAFAERYIVHTMGSMANAWRLSERGLGTTSIVLIINRGIDEAFTQKLLCCKEKLWYSDIGIA